MKKAFLILSIFYTVQVFSQNVFQKAISIDITKDLFSTDMKKTSDSGYVILADHYVGQLALVKINKFNVPSWAKKYSNGHYSYTHSMEQTSDGGYIFTGEGTDSAKSASFKIFLIKTDKNGVISWQKKFDGMPDEHALSVKQTTDGGFVICGWVDTHATVISYLIRTNVLGDIIWAKKYESFDSNGHAASRGFCVRQTDDGGFIMVGINMEGGILMKTNGSGEIEWCRGIATGTSGANVVLSSIETTKGGYIIIGQTLEPAYLVLIKTNTTGDIIWSKTFKDFAGHANSVKQTSDGGYLAGGSTGGFGKISMYLIKTDSLGDPSWARLFHEGDVSSVMETSKNSYLLAGSYRVAFTHQTSFIQTDSSGNSVCNDPIPPTITSNIVFEESNLNPVATSWGISQNNTFTATDQIPFEVPCTEVGIFESTTTPSEIIIYPNPSSGQFTFSKLPAESIIEIFDMLGKQVFQATATNDSYTINISEQSKGLYFYTIINKNKTVQHGKLSLN
jgi:hypothetical protein